MVDVIGWLGVNFATIILAAFTAVLAYATFTLRKATDRLTEAEITPMLVLEYIRREGRQNLRIQVANRGFGVAYDTKVFATVPTNVRFPIDNYDGFPDIAPDTVNSYSLSVIAGVEMDIELSCRDANQNAHSWHRRIRTPPEGIPLGEDRSAVPPEPSKSGATTPAGTGN